MKALRGYGTVEAIAREVRDRTPTNERQRARDIDDACAVSPAAWGFLEHLWWDAPTEVLPDDVATDLDLRVHDAAWDEGVAVLTEFAERITPILDAIDRWQ